MESFKSDPYEPAAAVGFPTTHWTTILATGDAGARRTSFNTLFRGYWPVLYRYFRWLSGCGHEEAKDLVQDFFVFMLEQDLIAAADPGRGRFRTFVCTAARNFWCDHRRRERALKRGGGSRHVALDLSAEPFWAPPAPGETPEQAFDRDWATHVLDRAIAETESTLLSLNRSDAVEAFRIRYLDGGTEQHEEIARRLGRSLSQVKNALTLARDVFRQALRKIVREGVQDDAEVEPEIEYLLELANKESA